MFRRVEGVQHVDALAADLMTAGLVGFVRGRRHSHRRPRSVSADGFSDGPGAYRVPVPNDHSAAEVIGTRLSISATA